MLEGVVDEQSKRSGTGPNFCALEQYVQQAECQFIRVCKVCFIPLI
jgi:hypothetical protein